MGYFRQNRVRIVEFNVENLFIRLDHYQGEDFSSMTEKEWRKLTISTVPNKPLLQIQQIARAIKDLDADVVMLCEVGGRESLSNFSRYFLNDTYQPYIIEGNSDRGIDIGYLVKRSFPLTCELVSHKDRAIDFIYPHEKISHETGYSHLRSARKTSHRFSRDVLEARFFETDEEEPAFVLLLVHLKSQLDRSRVDPNGRDRRRAEFETLIKIYEEIREEFENRVPILLGGDLNGDAGLPKTDPEFEAVYQKTDLKDCLEIAGVPSDERFTHMQIYSKRVSSNRQIDFIFVPASLARRVSKQETWVFRYRDQAGTTLVIPRNLNEKRLLPSDHYAVVLTLDSEKAPT